MATEMITLRLESDFLKKIDSFITGGYQNRTEFIRDALRDKIDEMEKKALMKHIKSLRGSIKKNISDKDLERVREEVFHEMAARFK
jgi:metal-responsive CopG/Arc/MetJ family transcriptional regulator